MKNKLTNIMILIEIIILIILGVAIAQRYAEVHSTVPAPAGMVMLVDVAQW